MPRKTDTGLKHTKTVKRGKVEYVYFNTGEKIAGKVLYSPLGRKDALEFGGRYQQALASRTRRANAPSSLTLPKLVQLYERSPEYTKKKSIGTQRTYSVYLRRLASEFDTAPATALEASDIYGLMDEMADRPAAVDMLILAGKQMFGWAKKRKYVAGNPFEIVDREEWEARQYAPWPEDLVEAGLADAKVGLPVALLYFTAQRIGDCCRMRWSDIKGDHIEVTQQKTKKELEIPIHTRLREAIERAPRRGETIMADAKGRQAKDQTVRGWLQAFGARHGHEVVPHGLRKNAVNALLEAECSVGETSAISGQSLRMVEHYAKMRNSKRMGREAMAKWERKGNKETNGKIAEKVAD